MLFEDIVIGAIGRQSRYSQTETEATNLRTQGNALNTEMMMKTFVIMPLTITALCWTARYRTMSTIL